MKTTLHNHVVIEADNKPLIPNAVFKAMLHLIYSKDPEAVDYIIKNYSFAPSQVSIYEYYMQENGL